jgi:membrane-associated phospholipid phosphatase
MMLIDLIWARCINFRVDNSSAEQGVRIIFCIILITGFFLSISRIKYKWLARKLFYENVAHIFLWITILVTFTHACTVFQYLCITTDFPLVSNALVSFDSALGFHWLQTYQWVKAHRWMHSALEFAYASGGVQLFVIPAILALTLNSEDYAEFVVQFIVSAILVILIAVLLPAESAFVHFGVHDPDTASTVSDFALLRSGNTRELVFASAQGLISMPSLHSILALCFAYSVRHVRFVFPIGIAMNFLMILSTPTQGGHYLFDVLSGLITGVLVIYFVRRVFIALAYSEFGGIEHGNMMMSAKD